jgi:hypothetical protein
MLEDQIQSVISKKGKGDLKALLNEETWQIGKGN